jgi:hypothetical protein
MKGSAPSAITWQAAIVAARTQIANSTVTTDCYLLKLVLPGPSGSTR